MATVNDGHGPHPYDPEFCTPNCKPERQTPEDRAYRHALIYTHEHHDGEHIALAIVELIVDLSKLANQYGLHTDEVLVEAIRRTA